MTTKVIKKRLNKVCAVCARPIKVIVYSDRDYRGGHYFGKIPFYTKKETERVMKGGSTPKKIAGKVFDILNIEGKPYKYEEYWECPNCYWR